LLFLASRGGRGGKESKERRNGEMRGTAARDKGEKKREKERERDTSGHEGERQIKFDRKLHEIVGEPRWSAPVL